MNDCIWSFIFCECEHKCEKYLSANLEKGREMLDAYEKDIAEVIEPVKFKWMQDAGFMESEE